MKNLRGEIADILTGYGKVELDELVNELSQLFQDFALECVGEDGGHGYSPRSSSPIFRDGYNQAKQEIRNCIKKATELEEK